MEPNSWQRNIQHPMIAKAAENAKSDVSKKEEVDPYPQEDGGSAGASD